MSYNSPLPHSAIEPSPLLIAAGALVLLAALVLTGVGGFVLVAALSLLVVFGVFANHFPVAAVGFCIAWLALCPYTWGVQTGLAFRLFADEGPLLLYLAVFPFLYLFTTRTWQPGFGGLWFTLLALLSALAFSFVSHVDLVAYRTFLTTYVLGALLLVLILQEAANSNPEAIGRYIVWVTVSIAALSLVERVFQRNPFVENTPLYFSAELLRATGGIYRPYVSFFHPSEAGAFMALGTPFLMRYWLRSRTWVSALAVCVVVAGLVVNGTRGVWFGLFVAGLLAALAVRRAWLWISVTLPVLMISAWIGYQVFKTSPFILRISNPTDLYSRFETWGTAAQIFLAHPIFGVGFGNFTRAYFDIVQDRDKVFTADNIFVSTAVENGLVGLLALVGFFAVVLTLLRRTRLQLYSRGLTAPGSFVRSAESALISYIAIGCFVDIQLFRKVAKYIFILAGLALAERVRNGLPLSRNASRQNKVEDFVEI